jgi:hypothetical protein
MENAKGAAPTIAVSGAAAATTKNTMLATPRAFGRSPAIAFPSLFIETPPCSVANIVAKRELRRLTKAARVSTLSAECESLGLSVGEDPSAGGSIEPTASELGGEMAFGIDRE